MEITFIQTKYIQKSRLFLYPMLDIKRGYSITPIQTYMSWKNKHTLNEHMLFCNYHLRTDDEFQTFETNKLLNNKHFHNFHELADGTGLYAFDFSEYDNDYNKVITGKYSTLSQPYKQRILKFFRQHNSPQTHIISYLSPLLFMKQYAKLLDVDINLLKSIGELCSLPDLNSENLVSLEKKTNFVNETIINTQTNKL